jgi:FAD/FMN-containing dehydrogenase
VVLPRNTEEVSKALTALVNVNPGAGDWHIAVRSGGHSLTGNNIENGVTIDLGMMNSSNFDASTNTASIQPGGRWAKAYADLEELGVVVTGGRDGGVGVGGLLLGGGYSFFSGHMGMACDSIVNYEVVLANGTVVNANVDENADLWLALKGGSGNFGIVTRFDMMAFPTRELLYETR